MDIELSEPPRPRESLAIISPRTSEGRPLSPPPPEEDDPSRPISLKTIVSVGLAIGFCLLLAGWYFMSVGEFRSIGANSNSEINQSHVFYFMGKWVYAVGAILSAYILVWVGLFLERVDFRVRLGMILMAVFLIYSINLLTTPVEAGYYYEY